MVRLLRVDLRADPPILGTVGASGRFLLKACLKSSTQPQSAEEGNMEDTQPTAVLGAIPVGDGLFDRLAMSNRCARNLRKRLFGAVFRCVVLPGLAEWLPLKSRCRRL